MGQVPLCHRLGVFYCGCCRLIMSHTPMRYAWNYCLSPSRIEYLSSFILASAHMYACHKKEERNRIDPEHSNWHRIVRILMWWSTVWSYIVLLICGSLHVHFQANLSLGQWFPLLAISGNLNILKCFEMIQLLATSQMDHVEGDI